MVERGGDRLKTLSDSGYQEEDTPADPREPHCRRCWHIYTDGHPIYVYAPRDKFHGRHERIDHNFAYGIGEVHTNTIENAFSLLKRGLHGTFHQVSKKHLGRYCDEFSYRFNRRKMQQAMFEETIKNLLNSERLTYQNLTAEISES